MLCALLIFALVSLAVSGATVTTIRTNRANQQRGVAVNLAHQVLECVKSQIQAGRAISADNAGSDCNPAGPPAGYTISGVAVTPNPSGFDGLTRVQITISWRSPLSDRLAFDWLVDT